jgi:hypothetical protein
MRAREIFVFPIKIVLVFISLCVWCSYFLLLWTSHLSKELALQAYANTISIYFAGGEGRSIEHLERVFLSWPNGFYSLLSIIWRKSGAIAPQKAQHWTLLEFARESLFAVLFYYSISISYFASIQMSKEFGHFSSSLFDIIPFISK